MAFLNCEALPDGAMPVLEMSGICIAQIWKGQYKLPSIEHMNAEIDKHHEWIASLAKDGDSCYEGIARPGPWYRFINDAAGTGVNEKLSMYGWEGWRFWWEDKEMYHLMMRGIVTPFQYRIFDGRRKKWEGAREAIIKANKACEHFGKDVKKPWYL